MWQAHYPNINSRSRKEEKNAAPMWYYLHSHICNFHKVSSAVSLICYGTHIYCRTLIHIFIYLSLSLRFYVYFFQDHITNCLTWRAEYNRQNCYIDFSAFCCAASQYSFSPLFFSALFSSFHKLSTNKWILSILIQFSIGGFYGVFKITFL
jgi:hypothetical protein